MPNIVVRPNGTVELIYADELVELLQEGQYSIRRVSHVEPNASGYWEADMRPIGGPVLGSFALRQQALDAEVDYLNTHVL